MDTTTRSFGTVLQPAATVRKVYKNRVVPAYVPDGVQAQELVSSPARYGFDLTPKKDVGGADPLGESLISLGGVCDDLQATPAHAAPNSPAYGFNDSMMLEASPAARSATPLGFPDEEIASGTIPADCVENVRVARAQMQVGEVRLGSKEVADVGKPNVGCDGIEFTKAKRNQGHVADVRMVNDEARGPCPGQPTLVNGDALGITTESACQSTVDAYRREHPNQLGAQPGARPLLDAKSVQLSAEAEAQATVHSYRRVNQQVVAGITAGSLPADCVENARTARAQANTADVRMVNQEVRGACAGERTLFGIDSKQLGDERQAQDTIAKYVRVSEQARGELAGQQTKFNLDAREMQRMVTNQVDHAKQVRINEQVAGVAPGTIPSDAVELARAAKAQYNVATSQSRNPQFRSEACGEKTLYDGTARQLKAEVKAQGEIAAIARVSNEARGELAGKQTSMDASAVDIRRAADAPKVSLHNGQVKHVGRGHLSTQDRAFVHTQSYATAVQRGRSARSAVIGIKSGMDASSVTIQRVRAVPKPAAAMGAIRASEQPAQITATSMGISTVLGAPKLPVYSGQMRYGANRDASADVKAADSVEEWQPEEHKIKEEEEVPQEAPATPEPAPASPPAWGASMFGLRKVEKPAMAPMAQPPIVPGSPGVMSFAEALRKYK